VKRARFMPTGLVAITADGWGADFEVVMGPSEPFEVHGDYAVVSVCGPLMQHKTFCWDSYEAIAERVDAALASGRPALMLKLSSPGGQVAGVFELAGAIRTRAKSKGKAVCAYVDGVAASAAYALACAADRIYVPATGIVGSIGCLQVTVDQTAFDRASGFGYELIASGSRKTDGNPHVSMSDEARAAILSGVNDMAATFFAFVDAARPGAGSAGLDAAIFVGQKAVDAKLADEVKTFAELVAGETRTTTAAMIAATENAVDEDEVKEALKAIAEGKDEKAAARAKKALAAYEPDGDEDKDKDKTDAKAESEDKSDEEDKEKDAKTAASTTTSAALNPHLNILATVQSLTAWKEAQEEKTERTELMASRPDFAKDVVAFLERQPLGVVRDAVKSLPRGTTAKGQVAAARAAIGVTPTIAQPGVESRLPPDEALALDRQMGLAPPEAAIRNEGTKQILGVMTPAQARAEIARRAAVSGKAAAK